MRRVLLAFVGLVGLGLYGCYDYTLPAEVEKDPKAKPDTKSETDPLNPTSVESGDSPNKQPTDSDAVVTTPAPGTGGVDPNPLPTADAGADAGPETTGGVIVATCQPNQTVCGGPYKLLRCNADATITYLGKCANGCVNGACNPPTQCVPGGTYCGGDKVNGHPDTLYKCGADGFATTIQSQCANGCFVAPAGQDDYCQ